MWKEKDIRDVDDSAWKIRIYLDIMLGYLYNFQDENHMTELITLAKLMKRHIKRITNKF